MIILTNKSTTLFLFYLNTNWNWNSAQKVKTAIYWQS